MSFFFSKNANYFLKVVEAGSFKDAAFALYLTHSALSIAIKNFEAEVGQQLFARVKKNAELTPYGVELAKRLLAMSRQVTVETESIDKEYLSKIRIGAIPYFAEKFLLHHLDNLPEVKNRTQLFMRPAGILKEALERGRLDFAFINWFPGPPGIPLRHKYLIEDPIVVAGQKKKFAHIAKAKSYKDLENEPWIYHEGRGEDWTDGIPWDKSGYLVGDYYSFKLLILRGYGIHDCPLQYFTKEEQKQLAIAPFPSIGHKSKVYAVWREDISTETKTIMMNLIDGLKSSDKG